MGLYLNLDIEKEDNLIIFAHYLIRLHVKDFTFYIRNRRQNRIFRLLVLYYRYVFGPYFCNEKLKYHSLNKFLPLILFCSTYGLGQNILSFSNDQFIGINGATFSPTTPYFNPNKWDINVISEDIIFKNDYAYISDQSVLGLTKGKIKTANPRQGITGDSE